MEYLKKQLPFLLYSCKRVSEIISKDDNELTLKEQLILLYHGTICRTCQHYKTQTSILENTLSKSLINNKETKLSDARKGKIVTQLKETI